jgi:class 3 adenylate cyclase
MIGKDQIPEKYKNIIDQQVEKFKDRIFTDEVKEIPDEKDITTEQSSKWIKIPDTICVFVDMKNSTKFSASHHAGTTAKVYTLFTGTAIRLFHSFGASYIDVKGDGVFALFNANEPHIALASAVTFKTFVAEVFTPKVTNKTKIDTGVHIGVDQATLKVSKIGLRKDKSRRHIHNEVWAGKAVNMAAKLASLSDNDEIHVSSHFFKNIKSEKALLSCECGDPQKLWESLDLTKDDRFSFDKAFILKSRWCKQHGASYLEEIINTDKG